MGGTLRNILFFAFIIILGFIVLLPGVNDGHTNFIIRVISYINVILFLTSIVSVTQFFWPTEINRTPYQVFNIVFAVVFYFISLNFLLNHKDFYDGYTNLSDMGCIQRFAFRWDIFSIMFWFILFAVTLNIIYVLRHKKAYLQYN